MKFMEKARKLYLAVIFIEIVFLSTSFLSAWGQASPSWIHPDNNSTECTGCHKIDMIEQPLPDEIMNGLNSKDNQILQTLVNGSNATGSESGFFIQEGGNDCVSCHDIGGSGSLKHIDASAIKQGVHANLNNGASNSTALSDLVNKACWACHGEGTEPAGEHPINYANPYLCEDCHNRTFNLSFTNFSIISSITTRKVFEHIQPPYFENIASTRNSTNANCEGCHDKSKVAFSDSGFSISGNVSHYASRTALLNPTVNCSLCHMNSQNAGEYWANTTRHPAKSQDDSFCDNCHNTSSALDFHSQPIFKPFEIHMEFDWQNDDRSEVTPIGSNEGCMSCHGTHYTVYKLCEDCHIETRSGPVKDYYTRPDINETLPRVYAHTNFSDEVNVPNQSSIYAPSQKARTFSSCYAFNNVTLEGTCHGNSYSNLSASGGFYAFRGSSDIRSTPYHYTRTIDRLPDTTNCVFCHNQTDEIIRKAWGNATLINGEKHSWYTGDNNSRCWSCHVSTGREPVDFHSESVTGGGGSDCISCHSVDVNISLFARHADVNVSDGQGNVTNFDCWTCHYKQNMNKGQVYLCESCHSNSSGIVNVTNNSLIKSEFMHGTTACKTCHAPSTPGNAKAAAYHLNGTVGPLGLVEVIMRKTG